MMTEHFEQTLNKEFTERMERLAAEGLVDCKMKLRVSDETTTAGIVAVLNNVLRLREEGELEPAELDF